MNSIIRETIAKILNLIIEVGERNSIKNFKFMKSHEKTSPEGP